MTISCRRAAIVPKECHSKGARSGNTSLFLLSSISACSRLSGELSSCIHPYTCSRFTALVPLGLAVATTFWLTGAALFVVDIGELVVPAVCDTPKLEPGPGRPTELGTELDGGGVEEEGSTCSCAMFTFPPPPNPKSMTPPKCCWPVVVCVGEDWLLLKGYLWNELLDYKDGEKRPKWKRQNSILKYLRRRRDMDSFNKTGQRRQECVLSMSYILLYIQFYLITWPVTSLLGIAIFV